MGLTDKQLLSAAADRMEVLQARLDAAEAVVGAARKVVEPVFEDERPFADDVGMLKAALRAFDGLARSGDA